MPVKKSVKYPCVVCNKECRNNSIECSKCLKWVHMKCVSKTVDIIAQFEEDDMEFHCQRCIKDNGTMDYKRLLEWISSNTGQLETQTTIAKNISLLLQLYHEPVELLSDSSDIPGCIDTVARDILRQYHRGTLERYTPLQTIGDGNCFYRAVSRACYGNEDSHLYLRLLTSIELLLHKNNYDTDSKDYVDLIQNVAVVVSNFSELVAVACHVGKYSELMHFFALSSALGVQIQSFFPPLIPFGLYSSAYTKKVCGRGVSPSAPTVHIMWSQATMPNRAESFQPNHFVALRSAALSSREEIIIDDEEPDDLISTRDDECHDIDDEDEMSDVELDGSQEPHEVKITPPRSGNLQGTFFNIQKLLELLTISEECEASIPVGVKNNKYFILDNSQNSLKKSSGQQSAFWDDCGAWVSKSGSSPISHFILQNGICKSVTLHHGQYCFEKQVNRKRTYKPVFPQPSKEEVFTVQRNYATLKSEPSYKRRITWALNIPQHIEVAKDNLAIAEYIGTFPGRSDEDAYIRTPSSTMQEIGKQVEATLPSNAYEKVMDQTDGFTAPRNVKQVRNKKYRDQKKLLKPTVCRGNFADNIVSIENMVQDHAFVQAVINTKGKVPSVICYTQEQIYDIKRFCCIKDTPVVWGFDKTFNVGELHVTASVFKYKAVTKADDDTNPIFFGPFFFHGNSDFETYNAFFSKLACQFTDKEISHLIFGTDDETALRKAIKRNFPSSTNLVCTRHLKNNVKDYLDKHVQLTEQEKRAVRDTIFGINGITSAEDDDTLMYRTEAAIAQWSTTISKFVAYFNKRLLPILKENVMLPKFARNTDANFTNNNCESANHVIKIKTEWKQPKLTELVEKIHLHIQSRYKDIKRALCGQGPYRVTKEFCRHRVNVDAWYTRSEEERAKAFRKFLLDNGLKDGNTCTTSDGSRTVPINPAKSKKLNQCKRPKSERTTTIKTKVMKTE